MYTVYVRGYASFTWMSLLMPELMWQKETMGTFMTFPMRSDMFLFIHF